MLVKIKGLNPQKIKPNCKKLLQTDFEGFISIRSEKKSALAEKAKSRFASPNLNWQTSFWAISSYLGNSEGRALPAPCLAERWNCSYTTALYLEMEGTELINHSSDATVTKKDLSLIALADLYRKGSITDSLSLFQSFVL